MSKYERARDNFLSLESELEEQIENYLKANSIDYFDWVSIQLRDGYIHFRIRSKYRNESGIRIDLDDADLKIIGSDRPIKVEKIAKAIELTKKIIWEEL